MNFGIKFQQSGIILLSIYFKNYSFLIRYYRDINIRQSWLSGLNNIRFMDFIDYKNNFSVNEIFIMFTFSVSEIFIFSVSERFITCTFSVSEIFIMCIFSVSEVLFFLSEWDIYFLSEWEIYNYLYFLCEWDIYFLSEWDIYFLNEWDIECNCIFSQWVRYFI
jgi:hypothetical protein